jgi:hypothetical protein
LSSNVSYRLFKVSFIDALVALELLGMISIKVKKLLKKPKLKNWADPIIVVIVQCKSFDGLVDQMATEFRKKYVASPSQNNTVVQLLPFNFTIVRYF